MVDETRSRDEYEEEGREIGRYRLLEKLGEGGFGTVWLAEQREPVVRRVALKVLRPGMASREILARFEAERQALALMDHPGIARVYDGGVTSRGGPYFVMELVRGSAITDYCDQHRLTTRARLELFISVCEAVQHAHHKGVVHRDLKPSNVLVSELGGGHAPKVIDFGIAKALSGPLTDKTVVTEQHQMIGTPEYMAPEQADVGAEDIDTRADVYSLGVILYELTTGTRPFELKDVLERGYYEVLRTIREVEPPRPSTRVSSLGGSLSKIAARREARPVDFVKELRGDIDWIVMRALEKERSRRYSSPNELAADVRRHLDDEPVLATPPKAAYRLSKYVKRHKVAVTAAAAVVASLVVGLVVAGLGWREALVQGERAKTALAAEKDQRSVAEREREEANVQRTLAEAREIEARTSAARANSIADLLQSTLIAAAPDSAQSQSKDYTVRELLASLEQELDERLEDDPEAEFALRRTLSATWRGLADYPKAEAHVRRSMELAQRIFASGDRQHAVLWNDLGELLIHMADQDGAAQALERAAAACDPEDSRQRDLLVTVRNNQSVLAMRSGQVEDAEQLALQALELLEQASADHPQRGTVLTTLGSAARARGDNASAADWLSKALEAYCTDDNSRNAKFAGTLSSWALTSFEADPSADVEPAFEEALAIMRRIYDRPHPDLAAALNNYGMFLLQRRRAEEAELMLTEGLEQLKGQASPDRGAVVALNSNLGALAFQRGDKDLAAELAREALEGHEQWFAPDESGSIPLRSNLLKSLRAIGDASRALPFARTQVEVCRRVRGATHVDTLAALEIASEACSVSSSSSKGDPELAREAEQYARELVAAREVETANPQRRWRAKLLLADALLSRTLTSTDEAAARQWVTEGAEVAEAVWNASEGEATKEQRQSAARQLIRAFELRARSDPASDAQQRAEEWKQRATAP